MVLCRTKSFSAPKIVEEGRAWRGHWIAAARATMTSRAQPRRTVTFTVAGADLAQTFQSRLGVRHYARLRLPTGATYDLIKAWMPGQYVKVTSARRSISRPLSCMWLQVTNALRVRIHLFK